MDITTNTTVDSAVSIESETFNADDMTVSKDFGAANSENMALETDAGSETSYTVESTDSLPDSSAVDAFEKDVTEKESELELRKFGRMATQISLRVFIILALFFVLLVFVISSRVKKSSRDDYSAFSQKIIEEDAGKISYWNEILLNDLRIYSDNDVTKAGRNEDIIRWIQTHRNIQNSYFNYILFCTPDGVGHSSEGGSRTVISKNFYRDIMQNNKETFVSNIDFQSDGTVCYYIARAAYNSAGKKIGVFAGAVKLDEIDRMVSALSLGKDGKVILAGSNGVLISHIRGEEHYMDLFYSDKAGYSGLDDIGKRTATGEVGEGYYKDPAGTKIFASFAPVPKTPWSVILTIPTSQIDENGNHMQIVISIIVCVIAVLILFVTVVLLEFAIRPLKAVGESIDQIASGDANLTRKLEVKSNNEVGRLGNGFNRFMEKLRTIVSGVKDSKETLQDVNVGLQQRINDNGNAIQEIITDLNNIDSQMQHQAASVTETASAVEEISKNIESLRGMIDSQADGVSNASAAVEEMIGNIRSVNHSVGYMAKAFTGLTEKAEEGISRQRNVDERIKLIDEQSKSLQEANKVISSIASQTNLLAMNAAIEAAHAGESGRGFAVVADEIRKLSETSTIQSKKIKEELKNIESSINEVVVASHASSESFATVSESIGTTQELVSQIQAAMEEQQTGSQQINDALKLMNDNTSEVREASREMAEGNKAILQEVNHLRETTEMIKTSMVQISNSAEKINESGRALDDISSSVRMTVDQIGGQIDLFTV